MSTTRIQVLFAPFKRWTPTFVWQPLRAILTAILTPFRFALSTGHFRSSLGRRSVSSGGLPIPWYTYPCIDLLATRDLSGCRVLEAGAGNSTLWWARKAAFVHSLEEDRGWYEELGKRVPSN